MQARLDSAGSNERRNRIYDQFEWLVETISKNRGYSYEPLERKPLSKPVTICSDANKANAAEP